MKAACPAQAVTGHLTHRRDAPMPHERTVRIVRYERASALLRAPSTRHERSASASTTTSSS